MSLRIVPESGYPTQTSNTARSAASSKGAPSAPGIHDTLRANLTTPAPSTKKTHQQPSSTHPLEARLLRWRQTQDALKMESLRRVYGIGEP
ncbi:hypothetical protein KEM55_004015, partial [Ascosphaera atra]